MDAKFDKLSNGRTFDILSYACRINCTKLCMRVLCIYMCMYVCICMFVHACVSACVRELSVHVYGNFHY